MLSNFLPFLRKVGRDIVQKSLIKLKKQFPEWFGPIINSEVSGTNTALDIGDMLRPKSNSSEEQPVLVKPETFS